MLGYPWDVVIFAYFSLLAVLCLALFPQAVHRRFHPDVRTSLILVYAPKC